MDIPLPVPSYYHSVLLQYEGTSQLGPSISLSSLPEQRLHLLSLLQSVPLHDLPATI